MTVKKKNNPAKDKTTKKDNIRAIILVITCTVFTSLGQIFWKYSTNNLDDLYSILTNVFLLAGFVSYAIGAVLLILALKTGDLSVTYPFIALSFIWVTLASIFLFSEHVSLVNWLGIIAILGGVSLIGIGSRGS